MKGNRPATVSLAARVRVLASRLVAALARALAPTFMANRARVLASTLRLAVRRLWVRRRYTAGLLAGFVLAVAAAASVPLFTAGALQRLLEAELRSAGQRHPAGIHIAHLEHPQRRTRAAQFDAADAIARTVGPALIGLPIDTFVRYGALEPTRARSAAPGRLSPRERWLSLAFLSDLEHHVQVTDGRLPRPDPTPDGFLEAMVEEAALDRQDLTVGAELVVPLGRDPGAGEVKVRIVGAFVRADPEEAYWFQAGPFDQHLFLPEETFRTQVLPREGAAPGQYSWYYGVPADALRVTDAVRLLGALYDLEARMAQALPDTRIFAGPVDLLTRYALRSLDLQRLLILLLMPALAAIGYFLVVTAGMMVEGQRQEIATLRSRGASPGQIAGLYLVEGLVLAGVALALGLPLGALLARAMGAVAGFLQFVRRTQPPLLLSGTFWGYGLAAAGLAALAYLLPSLPAARQSIVAQKQEAARRLTRPLWSRLGLDFLLLGLAGYSYYTLARPGAGALIPLAPGGAGEAWAPAAAPGAAGAPAAGPGEAGGLALGIRLMEPLHLVAPFLLILGAGLFLLRLVPLLAGLGARLAERGRGTALYLALVQLSRAGASYAPVILLLTVTVGTGVWSATAARTLERNLVDRTYYRAGADVVLEEHWPVIDLGGAGAGGGGSGPGGGGSGGPAGGSGPGPASRRQLVVMPPPWEVHYRLPGVVRPARVRRQEVTPVVGGRSQRRGTLMAVDAHEFGQVAWFRRDLGRWDLNGYLHLLAASPEAALVSRGFVERHRLQPGDQVVLVDEFGQEVPVTIYGVMDYWPALDPGEGDFFIANLDYVEEELGLWPYQVWLRMEPGAPLQPVVEALRAEGIYVRRAVDTRQQVVRLRRDPQFHGLMGGLSAGFLIAAGVSVLGFWLHAALGAGARVVQFGALRAMGLGRWQLTAAVALEQGLAVGTGVLAGTGLGRGAARLFLPFLQQGVDAVARTPPFRVEEAAADRARLYLVLLLMLAGAVVGLGVALGRLRIHEALKLGEDQG